MPGSGLPLGAPSHMAKGRADAMLSGLCPLHGKGSPAGRWPWARKCPRPPCPVFLFWRRSCGPGAALTPCAPRGGQLPVLSQQGPLCSPSTAIGPHTLLRLLPRGPGGKKGVLLMTRGKGRSGTRGSETGQRPPAGIVLEAESGEEPRVPGLEGNEGETGVPTQAQPQDPSTSTRAEFPGPLGPNGAAPASCSSSLGLETARGPLMGRHLSPPESSASLGPACPSSC